ncbi:uncharacterized protein ACR2FA_002305 [Aphomia sociella]
MFVCYRCDNEARDGVQCAQCQNRFDFPCAGITESGYRRLGVDRRASWKCSTCKNAGLSSSPLNPTAVKSTAGKTTSNGDLENINLELKKLSNQLASLPTLIETVRLIQADLVELKNIKNELSDVKSSLEYVHTSVDVLSNRLVEIDSEIQSLQKTKEDILRVERRVEKMEISLRENDQRSRLNNIEIKGVPISRSEDLYDIIFKISRKINCPVTKEQINYIARVPTRNNTNNKNIIIALHNRYLRDDFVAAARLCQPITAGDLGFSDDKRDNRIFINDHLTLDNKVLLNKAKALAKERNFLYIWVKNCRIMVKKKVDSRPLIIKSEADLKKIA